MSSAKVPMGIRGSHSREFQKRDILEYLINREVFWGASGIIFAHIIYSFAILTAEAWPDGVCSAGNIAFPLFFVVLPMWTLGHALILRLYERDMEPMGVFYNCILGCSISVLSVTMAIWIATNAWTCSSKYFRAAYLGCIIISFGWICVWVSAFLKRFMIDEASSKNSVSYLLIIRCACIPSGVRKILLVSPMFLSALFYSFKIHKHWMEECHAPLNFFSLTAIVVIALLGLFAYLILVYGRIFIVSSSFKDYAEEMSFHPMAMTALWYGSAAIHVFSIVWATIGTIWLHRAGNCSDDIELTAMGCIVWLYLFGVLGPLISFLLKVENCFPPTTGALTYSKQQFSPRSQSLSELLNSPSTHSMSGDRDVEMGSDLDLRRVYESQAAKKKKTKKAFKPGKYLWSANSSTGGSPRESVRGDSDSLLYPIGTVSADVVHHNPALSSNWSARVEMHSHSVQAMSPLHTHTHNNSTSASSSVRQNSLENNSLIQPNSGYSKRMGHLST